MAARAEDHRKNPVVGPGVPRLLRLGMEAATAVVAPVDTAAGGAIDVAAGFAIVVAWDPAALAAPTATETAAVAVPSPDRATAVPVVPQRQTTPPGLHKPGYRPHRNRGRPR